MKQQHEARENRLLAALPPAELQRLLPLMESVDLPVGEVLRLGGRDHGTCVFPDHRRGLIPAGARKRRHRRSCHGGQRGHRRHLAPHGGDSAPTSAVVQCAGHALRLDARLFKDELQRGGPAMRLLLRYAQAVFTLTSQTAVCNRYHSVGQQLCRRLLQGLDRTQSNVVELTHESIANALGVRREGVTAAACDLRNAGLIRYARGQITVLDRPGLQGRTCECYGVIKNEYDRLLATQPAGPRMPTRAPMKPAINLLTRKKAAQTATEQLEALAD